MSAELTMRLPEKDMAIQSISDLLRCLDAVQGNTAAWASLAKAHAEGFDSTAYYRCIAEFRDRLNGLLHNASILAVPNGDKEWEGDAIMDVKNVVVGRIYVQIGEGCLTESGNLELNVRNQSQLCPVAEKAIRTVSESIRKHAPLPSFSEGAHVVQLPPTRNDLRTVGDALNLGSNGTLVFREDADYLTAQVSSETE